MGVGADAGATQGVLGDARTAGDSERGGMADGSACASRSVISKKMFCDR